MTSAKCHPAIAIAAAAVLLGLPLASAHGADAQVERGKYLAAIGGCFDCHTRGYFLGKPDMAYYLAGSDVGFELPGLGVFVGPNLTPDKETGLGNWSKEQIVAALQTGTRPDGRILAPIMPWNQLAHLTRADAFAVAAYLQSLPPVKNAVPGPFGSTEKPRIFIMKVVSPDAAK
ncbi:MAG: c-type cytochrome [Alphaproteobacteria bacterium]